jgi:hypothetical protein
MKFAFRSFVAVPVLSTLLICAYAQKEALTRAEIEKIQDAQDIEKRGKIYLDAAGLRLRAAEERLNGQEAAEGDPLEFFTVEDMLDGYFQILKSVMLNLDDAAQKKVIDQEKLTKALKNLKDATEKATRPLDALKKMAEEKKLEKVWNLTNRAIDINKGANEGAEMALASRPALPEKKKK